MVGTLKNKNILVTGAAGFIGSHLCDRLLKEPINKLVAIDNLFLGKESNLTTAKYHQNFIFKIADATDYNSLSRIIKHDNIDVVFHLAVIPLEASLTKPEFCFNQNVLMTQTILEILRKNSKKITLISFSSSEAYGTALYTPMDENHPYLTNTPYAASKAAGDLLAYSYCKTFNLELVIVRPFNNYGPRQNEGSYAGVIPLTINRILQGKKPIIFNDGSQTRDFIFVEDTVDTTLEMYKKLKTRGGIFNIASGKQISIKTVVKTICKELNYQGEVEYKSERVGDVRIHEGDVKKIKKIIKYKPTLDFSVGIKKTIAWYKNCLKTI